MSSPDVFDISRVEGVGEFPNDPAALVSGNGRAFWESEPTGIWVPKAAETLGHLASGTTIVGLSGRQGVGKSMQFMRLLERTLPNLEFGYDYPRASLEDKVLPPVVLIDELGDGQIEYGKQGLVDKLVRKLVGHQAVVMTPGATRTKRRDVVESFMTAWLDALPDTKVHDLGDINSTSVLPDRSAAVVRASGGDEEAVQLFTDHNSLRQLRFFHSILIMYPDTFTEYGEPFGAEDVISLIKGIIRNDIDTYRQASQATCNLMGLGEPLMSDSHFFFTTADFTTEQAIDMYNLVGEPLPVFSSERIEKIGFDPYEKD